MFEENKSTRKDYMHHIEAQKKSGLSIAGYCEKHNLSARKMNYYRNYRLKGRSRKIHCSKNVNKSSFAQVQLTAAPKEALSKTALRHIDPQWLAEFLKELYGVKF